MMETETMLGFDRAPHRSPLRGRPAQAGATSDASFRRTRRADLGEETRSSALGLAASRPDRRRRRGARGCRPRRLGGRPRRRGSTLKRGEIWWADLGTHRVREQTGRRPVVVWQSDALTSVLLSVLVVPLMTNMDRAKLAGTALIAQTEVGPPSDSVALAFQMRAVPKAVLQKRIRALTDEELAELELATDEALGRVDPEVPQATEG